MTNILLVFLRKIANPVWLVNRGLSKATKAFILQNITDKKVWLDVGCGERPYESLFHNCKFIVLDVEVCGRPSNMKLPDLYYKGDIFPLESSSIDGILCDQAS